MIKNVTISLEEDLLVYARSLANAQAKSLSKFIADYFRELKSSEEQTFISLERYKSRKKLFNGKGLRNWKREDLYKQ